MRPTRPHSRPAAPWLRVLAALCAGLVVVLSMAASSPALHAWLHGDSAESAPDLACAHASEHDASSHDNASDTHDCAITLFSHGITLAHAILAVLDQPAITPAVTPAAPDRVAPVQLRHLRPQPQAPPVG